MTDNVMMTREKALLKSIAADSSGDPRAAHGSAVSDADHKWATDVATAVIKHQSQYKKLTVNLCRCYLALAEARK